MQEKNESNFIYNIASHKLKSTIKKECWFFISVSQLWSGVLFEILKDFKATFNLCKLGKKSRIFISVCQHFFLIAQSYVLAGTTEQN